MKILGRVRDGAFVEMVIFAPYCPRCRKLMIPSTLTHVEPAVFEIASQQGFDAQQQMDAWADENQQEGRLTYTVGLLPQVEPCAVCQAELAKQTEEKKNRCVGCGGTSHAFHTFEDVDNDDRFICDNCFKTLTAEEYFAAIEKATGLDYSDVVDI